MLHIMMNGFENLHIYLQNILLKAFGTKISKVVFLLEKLSEKESLEVLEKEYWDIIGTL